MSFDFNSLLQHEDHSNQHFLFERKLGGKTESVLVSDGRGDLWVVKLKQRSHGDNRLANELFGAHLCSALDIPVPDSKAVFLPQGFVNDPKVWFRYAPTPIRPEAGWHFASRYLPQAHGKEMYEQLPSTLTPRIRNIFDCVGMFVFDVWSLHSDERQAVFDLRDKWLQVTFIDNGEIFGGGQWSKTSTFVNTRSTRRALLISDDLEADLQTWVQRLTERVPSALTKAAELMPTDWYAGNLSLLFDQYIARLYKLPDLVVGVIAELMGKIEQFSAYAQDLYMPNRRIAALSPDGLDSLYTL